MTRNGFACTRQLFLEVSELPSEDRHRFLDEACGGDSDLQEEVEELLLFHEEDGGGDLGPQIPGAWHETPGSIGAYRLIRKIGEGGMGEVYEAEQQGPVRRRVALKLIRWGLASSEVLARFELERQALALMDHPNISRVWDAGKAEDGRPYVVMEYVEGLSLTEHCDVHRLTISQRLRLFIQVCQGVQHAHQKAIIHRDLKPSNVLVTLQDKEPLPKIIDFGVAKATAQQLDGGTLLTELGQWIGTPEYMSPEQASGTGLDIDTRTDVYSLGVLLYELLTGEPPFRSKELRNSGPEEMRRRIREQEPTRPSSKLSTAAERSRHAVENRRTDLRTLVRDLKGDLDWITMKALEKDRSRRYDSPSALAEDIRRHLRNDPVVAGAPSALYRVRKFVRRHRLGVGAGLAVVMALLLGIAGTGMGLRRARQEAESAQRLADVLAGMFETLDSGSTQEGFTTSDRVLGQGVARIGTELADQPLVQARLMSSMGNVYLRLGQFERARPLLEQALATRRERLEPDHPAIADSLALLGRYHFGAGNWDLARELHEEALSMRQHAPGADAIEVAFSLRDLGWVYLQKGEFSEGASRFWEALALLEQELGSEDPQVAHTLLAQATLNLLWGDLDAAKRLARRAVAIFEASLGAEHPDTGGSVHVLGVVHVYSGEYQAAVSLLKRSLDIQQATFGSDHVAVAAPMSDLGTAFIGLDRLEEAEPLCQGALDLRLQAYGAVHEDVMWSLSSLAWLHSRRGSLETAQRLCERALKVSQQIYPPGHHVIGHKLMSLADMLRLRGEYESAREHGERGLGILEEALKEDSLHLAGAWITVGVLLRDMGDLEPARALIEKGTDIRRRKLPGANALRADDFHTLARLLHEEGRYGEAERLYQQSMEMSEELLGPRHHFVIRALEDWARMLRDNGQNERAAELKARAVELAAVRP